MHKATVVLLIVAACLPWAGAAPVESMEIRFRWPAQTGPLIQVGNVSWALVIYDRNSESDFSASLPGPVVYTLFNQTYLAGMSAVVMSLRGVEHDDNHSRILPSFDAMVSHSREGPGSTYLGGGKLTIEVRDAEASLEVKPANRCLARYFGRATLVGEARYSEHCPAERSVAVIVKAADGSGIPFHIEGLARSLEWHNAKVSCIGISASDCPPGGPRRDEIVTLPPNQTFTNSKYGFDRLDAPNSAVEGAGIAKALVFGGELLDLAVDGWMRLPLAEVPEECPECVSPDNQTFFAEGDLFLKGLQAGDDATMAGRFQGEVESARFDETPIDPLRLAPLPIVAAGTAVAFGLVALAKALAGLFTRKAIPDALENPRRRLIHQTIVENPGISFRDLVRITGIAVGTMQHHVMVLRRCKVIVAQRHGLRTRFYENHGRYETTWRKVGALRDPDLKLLYDWVQQRAEARQSTVLRAMQELHSWPHSTTKSRLKRLVQDGLLHPHASGRIRTYRIAG